MWAFCVVVFSPLFNQDLCFFQGVEDFPIEQLIAKSCIEAFDISVFP